MIRREQWHGTQPSEGLRVKEDERQDKPGVAGEMDAWSEMQRQTCLMLMLAGA